MNACEHDKIQGWEECHACEAARLRRDLSEALGLLRAHQGATTSSGDDPGWQAWDAAVAALLAKYPPKVD